MKYSVGFDLCDPERIRRSLQNPRFLTRVFSPAEKEYITAAGAETAVQRAAANFSAKEAFSKALGTGIRGFSLKEVEVLRNSLGKPYFRLSGKAALLAEGLSLDVSLTHIPQAAGAVVIAERVHQCGTDSASKGDGPV